MFVVMDSREERYWKQDAKNHDLLSGTSDARQLFQFAEYVVVIYDDTYKILKDRFSGETGVELPLDELPNEIKQKLVNRLKTRDQVFTDD